LPVYGGTDHFINHYLKSIGVKSIGFRPNLTKEEIISLIEASGYASKLALIYVETPANPTNELIDIELCKSIKENYSTDSKEVFLAVDNTFMGPLWSHPLKHGADLVLYSATKYIGGHSDLIAGAVLGNDEVMQRIKVLRTFLGNMASPYTCWLLMRSLETLKVRMEQQARNAQEVARFLANHAQVSNLYYLGAIDFTHPSFGIYKKQYSSSGAMIAFEIKGNQKEAFTFLNNLKLIKLAVSLGGTESLAQHPATMTHAGVCPELKKEIGITAGLIRISIGVEHHADLIADIDASFAAIKSLYVL